MRFPKPQKSITKYGPSDKKQQHKSEPTGLRTILTSIASALAITGTFMAIFGYGVTTGIGGALGIDHVTLFSSPFDLLALTWSGIATIFNRIPPNIWNIIIEQSTPIGVATAVIVSCIWAIKIYTIRNKTGIFLRTREFAFHVLTPNTNQIKQDTIASLIARGIFYATGGFFIPVISGIVFISIPLTILYFLGSIVFLGDSTGRAYIKDWVIEPEHCTPLRNRDAALKLWATQDTNKPQKHNDTAKSRSSTCMKIKTTDGRTIAVGRSVIGTSDYVLLYKPETGTAIRVPIKTNTVVEIVDDNTR